MALVRSGDNYLLNCPDYVIRYGAGELVRRGLQHNDRVDGSDRLAWIQPLGHLFDLGQQDPTVAVQ